MRFTKTGDKYRAIHNGAILLIQPDEGGWMVVINGRPIEWFLPDDLAKAKSFAKARVAR